MWRRGLVGAGSLDVTWLLALVADALLCLAGAIPAEMSDLATVVALLTLSAVARHVTVTAAAVAGSSSTAAGAAKASSIAATVAAGTTLRAVTSNVTNFATLVAFAATTATVAGTASKSARSTTCSLVRAVTRDMACLATSVAGLFFRRLRAFSAHMACTAAVEASWGASLRAIARLVGCVTAVEAAASTTGSSTTALEIHLLCECIEA